MSVQMLRDVTDHHEKSSQRKRGNQQETQITYGEPPPRFEPRPLWLEASALTSAPTNLPPLVSSNEKRQVFTWCMGIVQARFMCRIQSVWFVSTYTTYQMLVVIFRSSCELNPATIVIDMILVVFQSQHL